jgi:ATP-dependent RNA helicase HelY
MARIDSLEAETAALRRRVRSRTGTLARTFERVLLILGSLGYVTTSGAVTEKGERLSRIYSESDLLVAEALDSGILDGLDAAELSSVVSTFVYETRMGVPVAEFETDPAREAFRRLRRVHRQISHAETDQRLELVREPDPGFAWHAHRWSAGADLEDVLDEMTPGDFVRATKQVWDLLRQLAEVSDEPLAGRCRDAASALYRGVVAYSGTI